MAARFLGLAFFFFASGCAGSLLGRLNFFILSSDEGRLRVHFRAAAIDRFRRLAPRLIAAMYGMYGLARR